MSVRKQLEEIAVDVMDVAAMAADGADSALNFIRELFSDDIFTMLFVYVILAAVMVFV